ncbi:MAG: hypothetical protein AB6733_07655 [Clostridiaceae bacterium]
MTNNLNKIANAPVHLVCGTLFLILSFAYTLSPVYPVSIQKLINVLIIIFGTMAILFWFLSNGLNSINKNLRVIIIFQFIVYLYMLFIGFANLNFNFGVWFKVLITQDLLFFLYATVPICFIDKNRHNVFNKIMYIFSYIGVLFGIFGLINFDYSGILSRTDVWTISYYCWWVSGISVFYCFFNSYITGEKKFIAYLNVIVYFALGILFLKRSAFLNLVLIVLFMISRTKKANHSKHIKIIPIVLIIVISICFLLFREEIVKNVSSIFGDIFSRFNDIFDPNVNDRSQEWNSYLKAASIKDILLGNGMGNYINVTLPSGFILKCNAIHIGWLNLIYKGGVVLLSFYIYLVFKTFRSIKNNLLKNNAPIYFSLACFYFIWMIYEGSWSYIMLVTQLFYAIYYLNNNTER